MTDFIIREEGLAEEPQRDSRQAHLAWCKARALEYVEAGDLINAFASMESDLRKHEGTRDHSGMKLGAMLMWGGNLSTKDEMRDFIEGFN